MAMMAIIVLFRDLRFRFRASCIAAVYLRNDEPFLSCSAIHYAVGSCRYELL